MQEGRWTTMTRRSSTDQIAAALFQSLGFCQRRLLKLLHLRVLARFRPQRREGGTHPYHYVFDQLGTEVVAAQTQATLLNSLTAATALEPVR
jgi:hypothetical protein